MYLLLLYSWCPKFCILFCIKYLLDNDEAPLSKRYLEVYNLSDIYSGIGDTTLLTAREDLIQSNFFGCCNN